MHRLLLVLLIVVGFFMQACSFEETSTGGGSSPVGLPPSAPSDVSVETADTQVTLRWSAVSSASSYNIYWSTEPGVTIARGTKLSGVSSPYVHGGLSSGATYYYVVTALNGYGESALSRETIAVLDGLPSPPNGVKAEAGDAQITVQWDAVRGASSYNVYWSNESTLTKEKGNKIENVQNPYVHKELTAGRTYYYLVTAANARGEGQASTIVQATVRQDPSVSQMRFVWVQDMGDGGDPFATGANLRLMGLDSGDGRGERVILGTVGNYAKPLLTSGGDRVVFSDRIRKKVYVVNFDGSGLRELAAGFGMSVWRDVASGKEWLYYGMYENKDEHCPVIYRMPIDGGSAELVWDKTLVSVDGFQVSLDGKRASGNYPWPEGGVANLPNGAFVGIARGCFTALSQDVNPLFWIFGSSHRDLYISDAGGGSGRWVNINGASGIDGYEVYHPKWGNNSRYMVMTGPYKVGSGSNRVSSGGREVEIYRGRFNAGYTAIESWVQVTHNDRGDFFPDVWVRP